MTSTGDRFGASARPASAAPDMAAEERKGKEAKKGSSGFWKIPSAKSLPWRNLARVEARYKCGALVGTAFFISPRVLATAAHNLAYPGWGKVQSITLRVAQDGSHQHGPTLRIRAIDISRTWRGNIAKPEDDYAVILLTKDQILPEQSFFRLADYSDPDGRLRACLPGYEAHLNSSALYESRSLIQPGHWRPGSIHYSMWTPKGFSGGPLYIYDAKEPVVIGVHVSREGVYALEKDMGRACRVSGTAAAFFKQHAGQP